MSSAPWSPDPVWQAWRAGVVEWFREQVQTPVARSAVEMSGADYSSWGGRVELTDAASGQAWTNGLVAYGWDTVIDPIRQMYEQQGQQHDPWTLMRFKEAWRVVLHENYHFVAPWGQAHSDLALVADDHAAIGLEEAVTELCTQLTLNELVDRHGLEQVAPGIRQVPVFTDYPAYVPAVQLLADEAGHLTARRPEAILRDLNVRSASHKYDRLAEIVIEGTGISSRIPVGDREACRRTLADRVHAKMQALPQAPPGQENAHTYQLASLRVGTVASTVLRDEVNALGHRYPERQMPVVPPQAGGPPPPPTIPSPSWEQTRRDPDWRMVREQRAARLSDIQTSQTERTERDPGHHLEGREP